MHMVMDFQGIRSAAQLSTVGYSFLILDMNEFFTNQKNSICIFIACSSMKGSQSVAKTLFLTNILKQASRPIYAYPVLLQTAHTVLF